MTFGRFYSNGTLDKQAQINCDEDYLYP